MKFKRIQRSRKKGFKTPENTRYVGRGSGWGNPFRVVQFWDKKWGVKITGGMGDEELQIKILTTICRVAYDTREEAHKAACECYEYYITPYPHWDKSDKARLDTEVVKDWIREDLGGRHLSCWCSHDLICHADYLLIIANERENEHI